MDLISLYVGVAFGIIAGIIANYLMKKPLKVVVIVSILFFISGMIAASAISAIVLVGVPSLSGMPKDVAISILDDAELKHSFTEQYNETAAKGIVISQDQPAGLTVKKGTEIHFVVSKGSFLGSISVNSEPSGGSVYLDGALKGITPITISGVSAGTHEIKIIKKGYKEMSKSISVSGGRAHV